MMIWHAGLRQHHGVLDEALEHCWPGGPQLPGTEGSGRCAGPAHKVQAPHRPPGERPPRKAGALVNDTRSRPSNCRLRWGGPRKGRAKAAVYFCGRR